MRQGHLAPPGHRAGRSQPLASTRCWRTGLNNSIIEKTMPVKAIIPEVIAPESRAQSRGKRRSRSTACAGPPTGALAQEPPPPPPTAGMAQTRVLETVRLLAMAGMVGAEARSPARSRSWVVGSGLWVRRRWRGRADLKPPLSGREASREGTDLGFIEEFAGHTVLVTLRRPRGHRGRDHGHG